MAARPIRTAIVTGGGSGIGAALAEALVERGTHVVVADVDGDAAARTAAATGAEALPLDVTDEGAFRDVVEAVVADRGGIDLLCCNAGVSLGGATHELSAAHWDHVVDVNLGGVVHGVLAAYPGMVERRSGHLLLTASGAGLVGPPFVAAYAATKHAVVGLGLTLRPEAALHGVGVTVLCPGSVETPILDRTPPPGLPPTASPPVTARRYLEVVRQRPVPAADVARRALRGVDRNRALVVAPPSAAALWYLHRISPALSQGVLRLLARRVDRVLLRP